MLEPTPELVEFRDLRRQYFEALEALPEELSDPRSGATEAAVHALNCRLQAATNRILARPARGLADAAAIAEAVHFWSAEPGEPIDTMPELAGNCFERPAAHLARAVLELARGGVHA